MKNPVPPFKYMLTRDIARIQFGCILISYNELNIYNLNNIVLK